MIPIDTLKSGRRILAVDAGTGTQDIFVFHEAKKPENCIKVVLPAMTQVLAKRIQKEKGDIFLVGETMGGGPVAFAIREHVQKGHRGVRTETAARNIRDDPEEVREAGIDIVPDGTVVKGLPRIELTDVDFRMIRDLLDAVDEPFEFDYVGMAVQDHGYSKGTSDRVFRFQNFREAVDSGVKLHDLMYRDPPSYFTRMKAALRTLKREFDCPTFVVDTKVAAMAGGVFSYKTDGKVMAVDIGNGHTTAAIVDKDDRLEGVYEHHTSSLTREKLEAHLLGFVENSLTNEDVLKDGGHGCYNRKSMSMKDLKAVLVTGPKRGLLSRSGNTLKIKSPAPFGDVMMTGTAGIVEMILKRVERGGYRPKERKEA